MPCTCLSSLSGVKMMESEGKMTTTDARGWIAALIKAMHEETSGSWPDPEYKDEVYSALEMAIQALSQEPCTDAVSRDAVLDETIRKNSIWNSITNSEGKNLEEIILELPSVTQKPIECDDAVSRDFEIGDEVRMIGSDPIYDDCDVGWVIRNASEKVKTMYVMRNDGSADEENKAEWYKTGRHNAVIAEVIKALPSVTQKSGQWISYYDEDTKTYWYECDRCHTERAFNTDYCPDCGCRMVATQESEDDG